MKKKFINGLVLLVIAFTVLGFISNPSLSSEKEGPIIVLPKVLHEISGLTDLGPTTIACVQDEKGIIFIYDFSKGEITERIKFAEDGDYEGITRINDVMYVLRSDGVLFKVEKAWNEVTSVQLIDTDIPAKDNEALCYDEKNNRLLIGSKVKSGKGSNKNERKIYAFNLETEKIEDQPAFIVSKDDVTDFADKNNVKLPTKIDSKTGSSKVDLKLGISGISIQPKTNDLYVLCANDFLLLSYNENGLLKSVDLLDKELHPQAEGITFYKNGDLFISNEGVNNEPTLIKHHLTPNLLNKK